MNIAFLIIDHDYFTINYFHLSDALLLYINDDVISKLIPKSNLSIAVYNKFLWEASTSNELQTSVMVLLMEKGASPNLMADPDWIEDASEDDINNVADPNIFINPNSELRNQKNILTQSLKSNKENQIKTLLDAGANIHMRNGDRSSVLMKAMADYDPSEEKYFSNFKAAKLIVKYGGRVNDDDGTDSSLSQPRKLSNEEYNIEQINDIILYLRAYDLFINSLNQEQASIRDIAQAIEGGYEVHNFLPQLNQDIEGKKTILLYYVTDRQKRLDILNLPGSLGIDDNTLQTLEEYVSEFDNANNLAEPMEIDN